ncbi:hypothetical protein [Mechercharimyces sp. CAU 1602]|uniref:hypothetical protein n=1 Tax=Mechercharimyces sp. CAU 1602 TaxID=2973933 RepID=UPI0021631B9B|nr:hypothetical protein [Mechercharimyces sp. CAU 1602]MCS1352410.1 hypothetical protein [Mechercharimyces sp. CAU 1602]
MVDEKKQEEGKGTKADVWIGVGICIGISLVLSIIPILIVFIGVAQLIGVIPAFMIARHKGRPGIAQGVLITAVAIFLLNTACWGMLFGGVMLNSP